MPMMEVNPADATISSASAVGVLTVASNASFSPGAFAWVYKDTGGGVFANARVKILSLIGTTQLVVRRMANNNELTAQPNYGVSDMSSFATGATISMERQLVPYDPAFSKHAVP